MKIVAFGASTSKASINQKLAAYAASRFEDATVDLLDLNDFSAPLFSVDEEREKGFPNTAYAFVDRLGQADFIIISFAEHNGSYSAAFKNIFDWSSRLKSKTFDGKKMLLLASSTGLGGGRVVLESALRRFPKHGAEILAHFSLPVFFENFSEEKGILNADLRAAFENTLSQVNERLGESTG